MEPPPRFDLNRAIAAWQHELAQQPGLMPVNVRELTAHMGDSLAELRHGGLNEEEAFLIACRRVGPPEAVATEFAKVAPQRVWAHRVFWMAFGALAVHLWHTTLADWWFVLSNWIGDDSDFNLPQWVGMAFLAGLFLLTCGLPVYFTGRWLARGRFDGISRLLGTRWRVAGVTTTMFIFAYAVQILATQQVVHDLVGHPDGVFGNGIAIGVAVVTEFNIVLDAFWPACLILLMVLLTPRRPKTVPAQ